MFVDGLMITGKPRDRLSPGALGVRKRVTHRCWDGLTLFSPAMDGREYLIDMNGMVVHSWPVTHSQYAELTPNGRLMADNYGAWIEEITPDGERAWMWEGPYHHDFHRLEDGSLVLLTVVPEDTVIPRFYPDDREPSSMRSDAITAIDRSGAKLWEFPFRDHVEELHELGGLPLPVRYATIGSRGRLEEDPVGKSDWAHANTVEVLGDTPAGKKDERFRPGNVLFSLRALDLIGVADIEKNEIVWVWGLGVLDGQHQPIMTPEGTIVIFDNGTARGWSAVVEIDPTTDTELWRYEDRAGFFSPFRGGVQRLPNGATLVAESDAGRLFEVTPDKEVVWDYHSPFIARGCNGSSAQGRHIYRATRYAYDDPGVLALFDAVADRHISAVSDPGHAPKKTHAEALEFYRRALGG